MGMKTGGVQGGKGTSTHPIRWKLHTIPTLVPLHSGYLSTATRMNRTPSPDPLVSLPCKPALSPLPPHHLVHCSRLLGLTAGYRGEPIRNREEIIILRCWAKNAPLPVREPNHPQCSFSAVDYHTHRALVN